MDITSTLFQPSPPAAATHHQLHCLLHEFPLHPLEHVSVAIAMLLGISDHPQLFPGQYQLYGSLLELPHGLPLPLPGYCDICIEISSKL